MKKYLIKHIIKYLERRGYEKQKLTDTKKVLELIEKLKPISFENKLIRLGPNSDGGYLILDDLDGIEACFSPGVNMIAGFEEDCAIKYGMKIFMADKSIDAPPQFKEKVDYDFIKKFIGVWDDTEYITLDSWVNNSSVRENSDLLLQMDIETAEYSTLLNLSENLQKRFRVMTIEFHNLHKLWSPEFFEIANFVFSKLLTTHYCVHIHPNNCCPVYNIEGIEIPMIMEFTFHRKDKVNLLGDKENIIYPHPLDRKNVEHNPDLVLPEIWQTI